MKIKYSQKFLQKLTNLGTFQDNDNRLSKLKNKVKNNPQIAVNHIIQNNIILERIEKDRPWRVMIPEELINDIIWETHECFGHVGINKTYKIIKEDCTFRGMSKRVAKLIRTCELCQKAKTFNRNTEGPQVNNIPGKPLETISIDLMGPLPSGRGGVQYILAVMDIFSKYVRLFAIKRDKTIIILNRILKQFILEEGIPDYVLTDNGTQFRSKKW